MHTTVIPIIDGIKYEARCLQNAISVIQAGRENPNFADSESSLAEHTERLFTLLDYFGNRVSGEDRIDGREEEQRLINLELGYVQGNSEALTRMSEEARKIFASPYHYVDLKRVNGGLYDIITGEFSS